MLHRTKFSISCLAMLLGLAGCGGTKAPALKTVPVAGTVTYNGTPLPNAAVTFYPADPNSGKSAGGTTDSAGKFTLETLVGGTTMAKGALVGDYKVTVEKGPAAANDADPMAGGNASTALEKMTANANNPGTEKPAGENMTEQVQSKLVLPARYSDVQQTELKASVPAGGKTDLVFELKD